MGTAVSGTVARARGAVAVLVSVALSGCGGGGGGGGGPTVVPDPDPVLAEANIGPTGGELSFVVDVGGEPQLRARVAVAAGVLQESRTFRLLLDVDNDSLPSPFPVYRVEVSPELVQGEAITVAVRGGDLLFDGDVPELGLFGRPANSASWSPVAGGTFDVGSRLVSATVSHAGAFTALTGSLHRLFTQPIELLDPEVARDVSRIDDLEVVGPPSPLGVHIGAGSLASFWNSPAADNVLIVHGLLGGPTDFLGVEDLVANLELTKANVVLLSYPSARGIQHVANRLDDLIRANAQPGFGCSIIAHSFGGLVARHLLERSASDPERPGYRQGQDSLAGVVDSLVMLGTPNAGAPSIAFAFAPFLPSLAFSEQHFVQSAFDLAAQPGSLPFEMNASYVDLVTRYHIVYGDLGAGSDGVVSVASALALPLVPPETSMMFAASHDDLHVRATSLGIAVWIGGLLGGP